MCKLLEYVHYLRAGDPLTSPDQLNELSHHECSHIRMRVAENPNISLSTAIHLMRDTSLEVRVALTENEAILPLIAPDLARDKSEDVRYALADNYYTPRPVLESLASDENPFVAARAARNLSRSQRSLWLAA